MRASWLLAVAVVGAACAPKTPAAVSPEMTQTRVSPEPSGWTEYSSPHFVISTDSRPEDVTTLIAVLEALLGRVSREFDVDPDRVVRFRLTVFAGMDSLESLAGRPIVLNMNWAAFGSDDMEGFSAALQGSLVVRRAQHVGCLSLGLAGYIASLAPTRGGIELGRNEPQFWKRLLPKGPPLLADLASAKSFSDPATPADIANGCVALVAFLHSEHPERLKAVFAAVDRFELSADVLALASGADTEETFRSDWLKFLSLPKVVRLDVNLVRQQVKSRPLSVGERELLRVQAVHGGYADPAGEDYHQALKADPDGLAASVWRAQGLPEGEKRQAFLELTKKFPQSPNPWRLLSTSVPPGTPERLRYLEQTLELAPNDPSTLWTLAWEHIRRGDVQTAQSTAKQATRYAYMINVFEVQAAARAIDGDCEGARMIQQRIADAMDSDADPKDAMFQHLANYQSGCKEHPAAVHDRAGIR